MTATQAGQYVKLILEEDFYAAYLRFRDHGILHYELTNIIEVCNPLIMGLSEDDRFLRYEVSGIITNYLLEE